MESWGRLLMKSISKIIVGIVAACLLAAGIYGTWYLDQSFDSSSLGRDGSYQKQFLDIKRRYFPQETEVSVVITGSQNYEQEEFQNSYIGLSKLAVENKHYQNYSVNWMTVFTDWARSNRINPSGHNFLSNLKTFLSLQKYQTYSRDIVFGNTTILASRIRVKTVSTPSSVFKKDAMLSLRKDLDNYNQVKAFPITYVFIYFEQFAIILTDTVKNLALSATAVVIVTSPYLVFPSAIFLVFLQFISLVVELLGLMFAWNVSLNSISMIVIIMAIGFSVDYSAHIAHAYVHNSEGTPNERIIKAMTEVGASVVMGGFTTFLGMLVTAFASSEVFRIFFKMVFGIVVLGLVHGLVFLPVFLSVFCRGKLPRKVYDGDEQSQKESSQISGQVRLSQDKSNKVHPAGDELSVQTPDGV